MLAHGRIVQALRFLVVKTGGILVDVYQVAFLRFPDFEAVGVLDQIALFGESIAQELVNLAVIQTWCSVAARALLPRQYLLDRSWSNSLKLVLVDFLTVEIDMAQQHKVRIPVV